MVTCILYFTQNYVYHVTCIYEFKVNFNNCAYTVIRIGCNRKTTQTYKLNLDTNTNLIMIALQVIFLFAFFKHSFIGQHTGYF